MERHIPDNYQGILNLAILKGFETHPAFYAQLRRGELVMDVHRIHGNVEIHVHDDYIPVAVLQLPRTTPEPLILDLVRLFLDALPEQPHMVGAPLVAVSA